MTLRVDSVSIPRYQTWGMVGIVLLLISAVLLFVLKYQYYDDSKRTADLYDQVVETQKTRLLSEVVAVQNYVQFMSDQAESVLMRDAKERVDEAFALASSIYTSLEKTTPKDRIAEIIRESLRDIRFFNGRGYFFIDDLEGNCILLPTAPHLEGSSLWDNQDDTGHYIMRGIIDSVKNPEGFGYSRYRWYAPGDNTEMKAKIAYSRLFEPLDWVIGTGDYLFQTENDLKELALKRIESVRFGDKGYIAVLDLDGNVLSTPNSNHVNLPIHFSKLEDQFEKIVVERLLSLAHEGGGFTEYQWYLPDGSGELGNKLSIVYVVPEWRWVLVAGVYPDELQALLKKQSAQQRLQLNKDLNNLLVAVAVLSCVFLVIAWFYGSWLRRLFVRHEQSLKEKQTVIEKGAKELKMAARVFETAYEGIMVTDPENKIVAVNRSFTSITGYSQEEVVGKSPSILSSGRHSSHFYKQLWSSLAAFDQWHGEIWNKHKNGECYPEELAISVSRDESGNILNYIATFNDISDKKSVEEQLRYLAEYDELTGLPNRRLLMDRVNQSIARAKRHEMRRFSLMFIDLDRFKNINDSLGHATGDKVLQETSRRLLSAVREVDSVSRIGGDEFVILITGSNKDDAMVSAATLGQRLIRMIAEPIKEGDLDLIVTPSIGIATYPFDGDDFDTLLRNADTALYHAKAEGRNNYQFYSREMNEKASARLKMEGALRQGLERKEFQLYYQPQYQLPNNELVGCEVLIRWLKDGVFIPPDEFIPTAEETGLILPIGEWVLEEACRQGVEWMEQGIYFGSIAVNVSAVQFRQEFYNVVSSMLAKTGYPASSLVLEVTETVLMNDAERTQYLLEKLKNLGIQIALDDFGTGYSSLAYLKKFPLDKLKIDRAFIDGLPNDKEDFAITASILDVAKHLKLTTVAEGVEKADQLAFLSEHGCDEVQGYYFSKPIPSDEFARLISSSNDKA